MRLAGLSAEQQAKDDDIAEMWGILDSGWSDRAIAARRLSDNCLGKPQPEIVGLGSSAGFDTAYCRRHPGQGVCRNGFLGLLDKHR